MKEKNDSGDSHVLMPAFILDTNKKSAFWENWLTTGEYAIDIVTTISGVGNILKFGRLYKVLDAGNKLTKRSRTFTKIVTGVKGVAGVAEISSGSVNVLLKLTGANDTDLGREISKYLFYFEMIALSGELSLTLYKKLKTCAKKIIAEEQQIIDLWKQTAKMDNETRDAIEESAKNADEAKQIDEVIEEIKKIADDAIKKTPEEMWKDFTYEDLMKMPPEKKPCFLAGTLVKTENGHLPIEQIKVGDKVYAYNFDKQANELKLVTELFLNTCDKYIEIYTGNSKIEATGGHRFWVPSKNKWVKARELTIGMEFLNFDGLNVKIKDLKIIDKIEKTYNFEVEDLHNYFVGIDEILSHNKSIADSIFASTETLEVEFYRHIFNGEVLYVGQTRQGIQDRYKQHLTDYRKTPTKKPWMKFNPTNDPLRLNPNDLTQVKFKMTPYEAAVTELYEINANGGLRKGNKGLYNKSKPIGKKKFEYFKKHGNFNPCLFYV